MESESKSPFGDVDGLQLMGMHREIDRVMVIVPRLCTDSGLNTLTMSERSDSVGVGWDSTGTLSYTALRKDQRVDMKLSCSHDAGSKVMMISPVIHFHPYGWVRLCDKELPLDHSSITWGIPRDIEEERLSTKANVSMTLEDELANLDRVHGNQVVSPRKTKPITSTYRSVLRFASSKRPRLLRPVPGGLPALTDKWAAERDEDRERAKHDQYVRRKAAAHRWAESLISVLKGIFGNPLRRRSIMNRWHHRAPNDRTVTTDVFVAFIETIMDRPVNLVVTSQGFQVFDEESLLIPYRWLTQAERMFFVRLYIHRDEVFDNFVEGFANQFWLKSCLLNDAVKSAVCPRQLVQEFSLVAVDAALSKKKPVVLLNLIAAVRACIHRKTPTSVDVFLIHLSAALQQRKIKECLEQLGMLVSIAGEEPEVPSLTSRGRSSTPTNPLRKHRNGFRTSMSGPMRNGTPGYLDGSFVMTSANRKKKMNRDK